MVKNCFLQAGIVLLLPVAGHSQPLGRPLQNAYAGFGAYSIRHADLLSGSSNPVAMAGLQQPAAAVLAERVYLLPELNQFTLAAGMPLKGGYAGIRANYFGSGLYQETALGVSYARHLGPKADAALRFNYQSLKISNGYGTAGAWGVEAGLLLHVTDHLHAGFHISNPYGGYFGKTGEKLAAQYAVGLGYDASEKFFSSAVISKEENRPVNVTAGIEYRFIPAVFVRAGIVAATSGGWLGLGYSLASFRLDVMAAWHPQLGITPGLGLLFQPPKKGQ